MRIKIKETGEIREVIKEQEGKVCIAKTPEWFTWLNPEDYKVIDEMELRIGLLRQWINELPEGRLISNEDIKYWLKL